MFLDPKGHNLSRLGITYIEHSQVYDTDIH